MHTCNRGTQAVQVLAVAATPAHRLWVVAVSCICDRGMQAGCGRGWL